MSAFHAELTELRLRAAVPYPLDVPVQPLAPSGAVSSDNGGIEPSVPEQGLGIEPGFPEQGLATEPSFPEQGIAIEPAPQPEQGGEPGPQHEFPPMPPVLSNSDQSDRPEQSSASEGLRRSADLSGSKESSFKSWDRPSFAAFASASGPPSDVSWLDYEPSPAADSFAEGSEAEAEYYRAAVADRASSEASMDVLSPAPVHQVVEAGAVADAFALDWPRVQDSSKGLHFPWEKGFMKKLFSDNVPKLPTMPSLPPVLRSAPAEERASGALSSRVDLRISSSVSAKCILCKADISYEHRRRATLQKSVRKLQVFISFAGDRLSMPPFLYGDSEEQLCDSLEACMGLKSCFTVEKRANSLLIYMRWAQACKDASDFLSEESVWRFFQQLKNDGAAKTMCGSVLSALRFLHHVVGVQVHSVISSRRLVGLAEVLGCDGRPVVQASELTVEQVRHLHHLLEADGTDPLDRYCIAYLLLALYARARHSDLCSVYSCSLNFEGSRGFLEFNLRGHKSAKSLALKNQLLPVLVPATSVVGRPWLHKACQAFEAVGQGIGGIRAGPLFKAVLNVQDMIFGAREVRSSEVTAMLRMFLKPLLKSGQRITSHSLRVTLLSWAAKFGIGREERDILGRHASAVHGAGPLYSRDLVTPAAIKLASMLEQVSSGTFRPDAPRLEYFAPASVAAASEVKVELPRASGIVIDVLSSDSSSDESGGSNGSSSTSTESPAEREPKFARATPLEDWEMPLTWVHKRSQVRHLARFTTGSGSKIFMCGRASSSVFIQASPARPGASRCRSCLAAWRQTSGK